MVTSNHKSFSNLFLEFSVLLNSEWFRTRLSPLLRSKAGQVNLWGLPKNVSLPKTLKNASLGNFEN